MGDLDDVRARSTIKTLTDDEVRTTHMSRFDVARDGAHVVAKERGVINRWIAEKNKMRHPRASLQCAACGEIFHISASIVEAFGPDCLGDNCPSYDIDRDVLTLVALGEATLCIGGDHA